MYGNCSKCQQGFDTHDGGMMCQECGYVLCPQCEKQNPEAKGGGSGLMPLVEKCPKCGAAFEDAIEYNRWLANEKR